MQSLLTVGKIRDILMRHTGSTEDNTNFPNNGQQPTTGGFRMKKSYTIEVRRHALKGTGSQKDMLSPEGYEQARQVGRDNMRDKGFTHIAVSPYFRTAQTAAAMAEGAGDFTAATFTVSPALFTGRLDEWMVYHKEHGAVVKPESDLIEEEAGRMANDLKDLVSSLPEGSHLLCVGHTPFVETLIYGLTGEVIDPLAECEGVEIEAEIDSETFFAKHVHELRL
ncbi:MAG TPA: histidine phosphatase family protein [bacterium]|nr:MAG: Histidine phosphatase superfamily (branch 1) [Parcubacteria group bacterium ADurb.Bin192]HPN15030.1 histidine phosphatase family protein [bacterium]